MIKLHGTATALLLLLLLHLSHSYVHPNFFDRIAENTLSANATVKPFYGCETSAYPPSNSVAVPQYSIDLALQPEQRWIQLVTDYKPQLVRLIGYVYNLTEVLIGRRAFTFLLSKLDEVSDTLPSPYRQEMEGIAKASGLSRAEVTLYNIFYEIFTVCTSIVVQDKDGHIYHGRNLDFGIFMGWNSTSHEWRVAELLRPLVVQLSWRRNGDTLFSSINYVGYVGAITAVRKGAFSFSLNERFSWDGGFVGLLEWIVFGDHEQRWTAFLTRDVLANARTYDEAKQQLITPRLLAPAYFILAGTQPGQGCIITRYRDHYDVLNLDKSYWFLVQTNYDRWKQPPFYDDRRTPAVTCLKEGRGRQWDALHRNNASSHDTEPPGRIAAHLDSFSQTSEKKQHLQSEVAALLNTLRYSRRSGARRRRSVGVRSSQDLSSNHAMLTNTGPADANASLSLLYNVLSTRPVLNKLTTYTTLMSAADGSINTWLRDCQDPCWPW